MEFLVLLFTIFMFFYGICTKKYNCSCDYHQMIKQWSAFKLFYQFRYTYIIEYLMDTFNNNSTNFEYSLNSQAGKIAKEFESQMNNDDDHDDENKIKILSQLKKMKQEADKSKQKNIKWYKRMHEKKIPHIMCFGMIFSVIVIGLMFGILGLVLKLQELSFNK